MNQQAFDLLMEKLKSQDAEFMAFKSEIKLELAEQRKDTKEILAWKDKLTGAVIFINIAVSIAAQYIFTKLSK